MVTKSVRGCAESVIACGSAPGRGSAGRGIGAGACLKLLKNQDMDRVHLARSSAQVLTFETFTFRYTFKLD